MIRLCRTLVVVTALLLMSSVAFASNAFRLGDQGAEIAEIQGQLLVLGYDVLADGDFGPATAEAVKAFQSSHGMKADGLIGPATYEALLGRTMPDISRGSNYISRRVIQMSMQYIGVPYVFGGTTPSALIAPVMCSMFSLTRAFPFRVPQMSSIP